MEFAIHTDSDFTSNGRVVITDHPAEEPTSKELDRHWGSETDINPCRRQIVVLQDIPAVLRGLREMLCQSPSLIISRYCTYPILSHIDALLPSQLIVFDPRLPADIEVYQKRILEKLCFLAAVPHVRFIYDPSVADSTYIVDFMRSCSDDVRLNPMPGLGQWSLTPGQISASVQKLHFAVSD